MGLDSSAKSGAFGRDHCDICGCDLYVAVITLRPSQPEPRFYLRRIVQLRRSVQAAASTLAPATAIVAKKIRSSQSSIAKPSDWWINGANFNSRALLIYCHGINNLRSRPG
jgi:hypothetical protein